MSLRVRAVALPLFACRFFGVSFSLAVGLSLHWRAAAWTYNCVGVSLRWRVDGASLRWRVASLTCRCCRCVDVSLRSRVVALACLGFDVSLSWHVVGNRSLLVWLAGSLAGLIVAKKLLPKYCPKLNLTDTQSF